MPKQCDRPFCGNLVTEGWQFQPVTWEGTSPMESSMNVEIWNVVIWIVFVCECWDMDCIHPALTEIAGAVLRGVALLIVSQLVS